MANSEEIIRSQIRASKALFVSELNAAEKFIVQNELDAALHILLNLSTYAYLNFTSFYTSYKMEKLLAQIGNKAIEPILLAAKEKHGKRKILHVASELYELGGHTPLLLKWIERDQESENDIFLTRQSRENIPTQNFANHNVSVSCVKWTNSGQSVVETAQALLAISVEYDFIVLHIHPNDVVPILAFANQKPRPIYLLNHADHLFWLGASIIDGLIQFRSTSIETDKVYRGMVQMQQFLLPIPITTTLNTDLSRAEVLTLYGVDAKANKILLTTSTESKFNPLLEYNYFECIIPVLNQNPDTVLFIVGISSDKPLAIKYKHPQIKFLGYLEPSRLAQIENIIDLYIETFPVSSFTAILQVLMKNKPIHFMFDPPAICKLFDEEHFYSINKTEWQARLNNLLNNDSELKSYTVELYKKAIEIYSNEAWNKALQTFYAYADNNNNAQPLHYADDNSFTESKNELFLFGANYKQPYTFMFFESQSKAIRINRIVSFLKLYFTRYRFRTKLLNVGLKEIVSQVKSVLK